jgi:translation elongation factor EF-1beta
MFSIISHFYKNKTNSIKTNEKYRRTEIAFDIPHISYNVIMFGDVYLSNNAVNNIHNDTREVQNVAMIFHISLIMLRRCISFKECRK